MREAQKLTIEAGKSATVSALLINPVSTPASLITLSAAADFGKLKVDIWRVLEDGVTRARAEIEA